jgi:hypothetical protein
MKILREGRLPQQYTVTCGNCRTVFQFGANEAHRRQVGIENQLLVTCPFEGCGEECGVVESYIKTPVTEVPVIPQSHGLPPMVNGVVQIGPPPPPYDTPGSETSTINKATANRPWKPNVTEI